MNKLLFQLYRVKVKHRKGYLLGWPKKFVRVFWQDMTEKSKQTVWPAQYLAQGHSVTKRRSQDSNPGSLASVLQVCFPVYLKTDE